MRSFADVVLSSSAVTISGTTTLSYFLFYTAYDKTTKKLTLTNLKDLVTLNRGLDWTLVEINKAISLSGLTTMLLSFLPSFKRQKKELLFLSMSMLWVHSLYSIYKFYGYSLRRFLNEKEIKKVSVFLGALGQLALSAGYWGYISRSNLVLSASALGVAHFWTMEVDYKYQLQVRPYAYLPFPLCIAVLHQWFQK